MLIKNHNSCISGEGDFVLPSAHLQCMELHVVVFWTKTTPHTAQICCVYILKLNNTAAADSKGLKLLIPMTAIGQNPELALPSFQSLTLSTNWVVNWVKHLQGASNMYLSMW
jgi:hypothetical protein